MEGPTKELIPIVLKGRFFRFRGKRYAFQSIFRPSRGREWSRNLSWLITHLVPAGFVSCVGRPFRGGRRGEFREGNRVP